MLFGLFLLPSGYGATQTRRANLDITLDTDPVFPDTASRCGSITPAWFFKMTLAETGGVGFTVTGYSVDFYDDNLVFINTISRTPDDFAGSFDDCGAPSVRIAANSQVCGFQCIHLGGRRSGSVVFTFFGTEDTGLTGCFVKKITLLAGNQDADLSVTIVSSTTGFGITNNQAATSAVLTGRRLLYTIRVLNNGPKTATGVTLNTSTPAGTTFSSIALSQGTSSSPIVGGVGTVNCFLDSIGPKTEAIISLVVKVTAASNSTLTANASVTSTSSDPNPEDNSATDTASVVASTGGASSQFDLAISTSSPSETLTSGGRLTYTVSAKNIGPGIGGGSFIIPLPPGTTFSSVSNSSGSSCLSPPVGSGGALLCGSGLLDLNETANVNVTVNVLNASGAVLSNKAEVIEGGTTQRPLLLKCFTFTLPNVFTTQEINPNNDTGVSTKTVQGGSLVNLFWQQPAAAPTSADAARNAVPTLTRVSPATVAQEAEASAESIVPEDDNGCTLIRVNIYKSDQPNVQPSPANLWRSVAPDKLQATMAAAPAGSFFRLANIWQCGNSGSGGGSIESGRSNEVNSAGAQIPFIIGTPTKQGKALIVTGENFNSGAKLLINGLQQKTSVEASTRLFCKKAGKKVRSGDRLQVRNSDGGLSPEVTFP